MIGDSADAPEIEPEDRLYGILCADGGIIPCATDRQRDHLWAHMQKCDGTAGCRIPKARLTRATPDAAWQRITA